MKYNYIGQTGLMVSELCFGAMTFGGQNAGIWENIGKLQQKEVNELIKEALDSGINFFDTANAYSFGQSEQLLGQSLKDLGIKRDEIVIATKVLARMKSSPNSLGLSRYHIFNSVDESLKRLNLDHIDILYVHGVDPRTSIEEVLRTLNDIVNTGKVRYIAICNWPAWMVAKAQAIAHYNRWHKFIGLQYYYSIASRDIEHELIPMAKDHNLAIFPWSPLAGGFLTGKFSRDGQNVENARRSTFDFPPLDKEKALDIVDVLKEISGQYNATAAQVALAWVRQQQAISSTIIGAKTMEQLKENILSTSIVLSGDHIEKLNKISALPLQYPGWMVRNQGVNRM